LKERLCDGQLIEDFSGLSFEGVQARKARAETGADCGAVRIPSCEVHEVS